MSTKIEWTERTWNPVRGCSVISPGCHHCYAMKMAHRFGGPGKPYAGLTKQTKRSGPQWTGKVMLVEDHLTDPLKWPKPQRVFVNSMSDLFHESVPIEFIAQVFDVMASATVECGKRHKHEPECWTGPKHTFQILTKRADRMRQVIKQLPEYFDNHFTGECAVNVTREFEGWPLKNVWLGVSVENQKYADERVPHLMHTPAAVRFVSAEPLLGALDLRTYLNRSPCDHVRRSCKDIGCWGPFGLDWVIVGGESGSSPRPLWVPSVRSIVERCNVAKVPVFVKQLGANVQDRNDAGFNGDFSDIGGDHYDWPEQHAIDDRIEEIDTGYQGAPVRIHLTDRKGGDPNEWPPDLRVRQFPTGAQ